MDKQLPTPVRKIFVGNIPTQVTEAQLKTHFSLFGRITKLRLMQSKNTTQDLNYAFVTLASPHSVDHIISVPHIIEESLLFIRKETIEFTKHSIIRFCQGQCQMVYLFIQDVPKSIDQESVIIYFRSFGALKSALLFPCSGKSHDRIYLQYESLDAMAVVRTNKHKIPASSKKYYKRTTLVCKFGLLKGSHKQEIFTQSINLLELLPASLQSNQKVNDYSLRPEGRYASKQSEDAEPFLTYENRSSYATSLWPDSDIRIEGNTIVASEGLNFSNISDQPTKTLAAMLTLSSLNSSPNNYRWNISVIRKGQ